MVLRWGFIGCGKIANDFANAMKSVKESKVVACSARSKSKAEIFAQKHGISKFYGSYEQLCQDEDVDIVYVNTLNVSHFEHSLLALQNKKHVLVEKPMSMNLQQSEIMERTSKENGCFFMEGMWTRFFPAVEKVRNLLNAGVIGEVHTVNADFGVKMPEDIDRIWDPALGGGGLLDIGIYPISFVSMVFSGQIPDKITSCGKLSSEGIDTYGSVTLEYPSNKYGTIQYTCCGQTPEEVVITGTKGNIKVCSPFHAPEQIEITYRQSRSDSQVERLHYPIPKAHLNCSDFNFPGSNGFQYEIRRIEECIRDGLLECPEMKVSESLLLSNILDTVRRQIGVSYPSDKVLSGLQ